MTQAQDEARRRNALKSTGPRTEEGKRRVRMNALKHGLRSQILGDDLLVRNPQSEIQNDGYDEILEELTAHYSPATPIEHMLVKRIAVLYWRLGRIELAEQNAIQSYPGNEFAIPPAGALDRILKYERTMDRQLHQAIDHLEKLISSRTNKQEEQTI